MPRFPLVRALIALFVAFICLSRTTPALAQDAGVGAIPVPDSFGDGGVPQDAARAQPPPSGDGAASLSVDGGGQAEGGGQRTPASEEVVPRPLALPPTEAELARNLPIAAIEIVGNRRVSK